MVGVLLALLVALTNVGVFVLRFCLVRLIVVVMVGVSELVGEVVIEAVGVGLGGKVGSIEKVSSGTKY